MKIPDRPSDENAWFDVIFDALRARHQGGHEHFIALMRVRVGRCEREAFDAEGLWFEDLYVRAVRWLDELEPNRPVDDKDQFVWERGGVEVAFHAVPKDRAARRRLSN